MALFSNPSIQKNIRDHQAVIKKRLNETISRLNVLEAEYVRMVNFMHEEALAAEIVDRQDSNKFLGMIGRKADKIRGIADKFDALKALKGANNAETDVNMAAHKTSTNYIHQDVRDEYNPE